VSETHSFRPLWRPRFVTRLRRKIAASQWPGGERRQAALCHRGRRESDLADGWREKRRDGGVVIDVSCNEIVLRGLSMPHSPRLHDGQLWLLNSGTGFIGRANPRVGGSSR